MKPQKYIGGTWPRSASKQCVKFDFWDRNCYKWFQCDVLKEIACCTCRLVTLSIEVYLVSSEVENVTVISLGITVISQ